MPNYCARYCRWNTVYDKLIKLGFTHAYRTDTVIMSSNSEENIMKEQPKAPCDIDATSTTNMSDAEMIELNTRVRQQEKAIAQYKEAKLVIAKYRMNNPRLKLGYAGGFADACLANESMYYADGFYYLGINHLSEPANELKFHIPFENYQACGLHVLNVINNLNLTCVRTTKLVNSRKCTPERIAKYAPVTVYFHQSATPDDIAVAAFTINQKLQAVSKQISLNPAGVAESDELLGEFCALTISSHEGVNERETGWEKKRKKIAEENVDYNRVKELYLKLTTMSVLHDFINDKNTTDEQKSGKVLVLLRQAQTSPMMSCPVNMVEDHYTLLNLACQKGLPKTVDAILEFADDVNVNLGNCQAKDDPNIMLRIELCNYIEGLKTQSARYGGYNTFSGYLSNTRFFCFAKENHWIDFEPGFKKSDKLTAAMSLQNILHALYFSKPCGRLSVQSLAALKQTDSRLGNIYAKYSDVIEEALKNSPQDVGNDNHVDDFPLEVAFVSPGSTASKR